MPVSPRLLKRRIKSIRSTRKIMKAMELVAASKMRKTTQLTLNTRPYSGEMQAMVDELRRVVPAADYELLVGKAKTQATNKTLLVIASSDRGLCGGFNNQLLKKTFEHMRARPGEQVQAVTIGKRAEQALRRANIPLIASFPAISNAPAFERALPVSQMIATEFLQGHVNKVFMIYANFKSALVQIPTVVQLLPIIPETELAAMKQVRSEEDEERDMQDEEKESEEASQSEQEAHIMFEPSAKEVLRSLLPRLLEVRIYQLLLESSASEHAARMMAMRSAGDAASDVMETLTLTMNQARQANITREISEIAAGKAAVE